MGLFYVPYCMFRHSFKEKCPLSGAKTRVQYVNPSTFLLRWYRYVLLCFITLLQVRIAADQNSNIRGPSLKINPLSCWKYDLHQTQSKTYLIVLTMQNWYKNAFVDATMPFKITYMQILTVLLNHSYTGFEPELLTAQVRLCKLLNKPTLPMKTHRYKAGYVWC